MKGQEVRLSSSIGIITRVVVADCGDVVAVCRPEEFARAAEEGREPTSVGFRKADIVAEAV